MKTVFGFLTVFFFLSGCSATDGSTSSAAADVAAAEAEAGDDVKVADAEGDQVYCRREHTLRGSRFNTRICRTASQITEEERAQQRMREGVRRMQDHASHERTEALRGDLRQ